MPKQQISTNQGAAPSGAYSQRLKAGDFVFVSGQGAFDSDTGELAGQDIREQTAQTKKIYDI